MVPGRQFTIDWAVKALIRRRWLVIIPLFFGVLGGLLASRFMPSVYRSDALIEVVPQRVPENYVQATVTSRVEDRLAALSQQVLSRTQMESVINEFKLYPNERRRLPMEDVFELMTTGIEVVPVETVGGKKGSRDQGVEAFRISFNYSDPKIARDVVAKLASFFIDRNSTERRSQADRTSTFLDSELDDARKRLEDQEKKLKTFREKNSGRLPTQMQANMQAIQTSQLALQALMDAQARNRDRKLVLERLYADAAADLQSGAGVATPTTAGQPTAAGAATRLPADATPRQRLDYLKKALPQLQVRFSDKHPDVARTKRDIAELEKQVAAEDLAKPVSPGAESATASSSFSPEELRQRERLRQMRIEIESLDRQIATQEAEEKRMRQEISGYQSRLEAVPGIESEWVALTRDYDTLQASYRTLLSKSENSKMAASLERQEIGEQFGLLDPPRIPLKPKSPNRLKLNGMGAAIGLGLGLALVGLLEIGNSTMKTEAELMGTINLPVLALLPLVKTAADLRRERRNRWLTAAAVVVVGASTAVLAWVLQLWKYVM